MKLGKFLKVLLTLVKFRKVVKVLLTPVKLGWCKRFQAPVKLEVIRELAPVKQVVVLFSKEEDSEFGNPK